MEDTVKDSAAGLLIGQKGRLYKFWKE